MALSVARAAAFCVVMAGIALASLPVPQAPPAPTESESERTFTTAVIHWLEPVNFGSDLQGYEVSYRAQGSELWITDTDAATGVIGTAAREVQVIATRADFGQTISRGWFRLALNYKNITMVDPEVKAETDLIRFDATEAEMKTALEALEDIDIVEVRRYGPYAQNTYEWKVTLDWRIPIGNGSEDANATIGVTGTGMGIGSVGGEAPSGFGTIGSTLRGNLPLIVPTTMEQFDVTWRGSYQTVWVREVRKGSLGPQLCEVYCHHTVESLTPGEQYQFRVRARNEQGWSEWSGASNVIRMPTIEPPTTPDAPTLLSATSDSVILSLLIPARRDGGPKTGIVMETQYQIVPDRTPTSLSSANSAGGYTVAFPYTDGGGDNWVPLPLGFVESLDTINVVATGLRPATTYQFRTRAVVPIGVSAWSGPSATITTAAAPPDPPVLSRVPQSDVGYSTVALQWTRGSNNGNPVLSYDIQYRVVGKTEWFEAVKGLSAILDGGVREVQTVSSRTDIGHPITRGSFTLSFGEGVTASDEDIPSTTKPIAWNATAGDVKAALEFLPGVGTVEVRRDGGSVLGEFTWQITLDWEKGPLQLRGDWNPIIADASQLGGKWSGDGQSVVVRELRKGQKATIRGLPSADELLRANFTNQPLSSPTTPAFTVNGLLPLTLYQFRVRPINAIGAGDWSIVSPRIRTKAAPFGDPSGLSLRYGEVAPHAKMQELIVSTIKLPLPPLPSGSRMLGGSVRYLDPAAMADVDYVAGIGLGGSAGGNGGHGMVVIHMYTGWQYATTAKTVFYHRDPKVYGNSPQLFVVPDSGNPSVRVDHIVVKLWGAGGGSCNSMYSQGGAGGFVQTKLRVFSGQILAVFVGGGGQGTNSGRPGSGGNNGGADGGFGDFGGAGGGGSTSIHGVSPDVSGDRKATLEAQSILEEGDLSVLMAIPLVVAAGGGGAGHTDYCCGHGGGGGGGQVLNATVERGAGMPGYAPVDTPRTATGNPELAHNAYNDARDFTDFPPYSNNLDHGLAPQANLTTIAVSGRGGGLLEGGFPGPSGSWKISAFEETSVNRPPDSPPNVYPIPDESSNPTVGSSDNPRLDPAEIRVQFQSALSTPASRGGWGQGGKGAAGKEGGGGGGGGLFGGGGGGAGIDAAGGGGGTSYIHLPALWVPPPKADPPPSPTVVEIRSSSVALSWPILYLNGAYQSAAGYIVEMAVGPISDEFLEVFQSTSTVTSFVQTGLNASTIYRFRLRANDYKMGPSHRGPAVTVTTLPKVVNRWKQIYARTYAEARAGGGRRYADSPSDEVSMFPSPLQGASLNPMVGYLFMFGGRSTGQDCDFGITEHCRYFDSVNNFLWRLDPLTYTWEQLPTYGINAGLPFARERHAAGVIADKVGVLGEKLLIFGGRRDPDPDGGGGPYLNDIWELNPGAERIRTATGSTVSSAGFQLNPLDPAVGHAYPAGGLPEGRIEFVSANIVADPSPPDEECVMDVQVWVTVHHPCLQELRLSLWGPGPAPYHSPGAGFALGERAPQDMPRGEENVLFVGGSGYGTTNKAWACASGGRGTPPGPAVGLTDDYNAGHTMWFDDRASEPISKCCQSPDGGIFNGFMDGRYRPVDSLGRFRGLPANGPWQLSLYDPFVNGVNASLISWGVRIHTGPCKRRYRWTKLTPINTPPSPRFDAATIVVDRSMFVYGGRSVGIFDEMWRFDYDSLSWHLLPIPKDKPQITTPSHLLDLPEPNFVLRASTPLGRSGVLTPWGVLTFGGKSPFAHHIDPSVVQRWDLISGNWYSVNPPPIQDRRHKHPNPWKDPNYDAPGRDHLYFDFAYSAAIGLNEQPPVLPRRRVLPAVAFIGEQNTRSRLRGVDVSKLVVYGGYDHAEPLNDLWEFSLVDVLHESELAALSDLPVDAGTGVLHGLGDGYHPTPNDITGFGTGSVIQGPRSPPGGVLIEAYRALHCNYRLVNDSGADRQWKEGCMGFGSNVCGIQDVLIRAWCTHQYQSIGSF